MGTTIASNVLQIGNTKHARRMSRYIGATAAMLGAFQASVTKNMNERGGGILDIELINRADLEPNYYQLQAKFETCDAMGANFINSLLEKFSKILQ